MTEQVSVVKEEKKTRRVEDRFSRTQTTVPQIPNVGNGIIFILQRLFLEINPNTLPRPPSGPLGKSKSSKIIIGGRGLDFFSPQGQWIRPSVYELKLELWLFFLGLSVSFEKGHRKRNIFGVEKKNILDFFSPFPVATTKISCSWVDPSCCLLFRRKYFRVPTKIQTFS